jgi:hypothetical protein
MTFKFRSKSRGEGQKIRPFVKAITACTGGALIATTLLFLNGNGSNSFQRTQDPASARQDESLRDSTVSKIRSSLLSQRELLSKSEASVLDSIIRTYNENTLDCRRVEGAASQEELLKMSRHSTPGSSALRYPGESENIDVIDRVEQLHNPDVLFGLLNYFNEIGAIDVDEHGWTVSSANRMMQEDIASTEWSFDSACVSRNISAFNLSRRILLKLVEMSLQNEEPLIREVADNIPGIMGNLFSHRMARELFGNQNSFSPGESNRVLLQLSDEQKWAIFEELVHFASVNESYLDKARRVHEESDDEIILEGLRRVITYSNNMPSL